MSALGDLSPEGINRRRGEAVWRCWGCKAETGLHWHNGWSVAMCRKPECASAYDEMCARQIADQEWQAEYARQMGYE